MSVKGEILVVDDDIDIKESLKIILSSKGYSIRTAGNGQEAIECLKSKKPDLIILDVMMTTDTEGFDVAYELKQDPDYEGLPIIFLTSFLDKVREDGPDQFQHILGESWPAKWFFEKPIDSKKLLDKIESILSNKD